MELKILEEKIYQGMFKLDDGRPSKVLSYPSKKELRKHLHISAMDSMGVTGSKWVEVLIWNQFGYVQDHYVLMADGTRGIPLSQFLHR